MNRLVRRDELRLAKWLEGQDLSQIANAAEAAKRAQADLGVLVTANNIEGMMSDMDLVFVKPLSAEDLLERRLAAIELRLYNLEERG